MMDIFEKHQALQQIVREAQMHIITLRKECPHAIGTYTYKGYSGNWDTSDDCYWKEMACCHCGKLWTEWLKIDGVRNAAYHNNPEGEWNEVKR